MPKDHNVSRRRTCLREQPISRLFPNMITIAGLCWGLPAVRFAMLERYDLAVGFILAAALIDNMDGRVARMLGATSLFGEQLDSLSDFLCFGVAPPLVLYIWQLHVIKGIRWAANIGWAVVLFFAVCTALRLARFNTGLIEEKEPWEKQFFVGVPSPAGAILSLLPLIISLQSDQAFAFAPAVIACYVLLIGTLMVSRVPTFAGKHIRIKHGYIPQSVLAGSFLFVVFIIKPWLCLSLFSLAYLASIYFSMRRWKRLKGNTV